MKLSLRILLSKMNCFYSIVSFQNDNHGFCYDGVRLYHAGTALQDGTVYVAKFQQGDADIPLSKCCAFIFVGGVPANYVQGQCDYIELKKTVSTPEVINRVYDVFTQYWHWQEQMQQVLIGHKGLQQLFDVALPIFINPVFYVDTTWTIRAYAEYPELLDTVQIYGTTNIQTSLPFDLKNSSQQFHSYTTTGPTLWEEDEFTSFPELYCNIFLDTVFVGRVFVDSRVHPFTEGDYDTLEIFCDYVKIAVDNREYSPMSNYRILERNLAALLDGNDIEASQLWNELRYIGWEKYTCFFLMLIQLEERDNAAMSVIATCNTIEAVLLCCRAFPYCDHIVVLIPAEAWGNSRDNFTSRIAPIIRDGVFKASVSGIFCDILQMKKYYQQAKYALNEGIKSNSQQWIYKYEDFMLSHILHMAVTGLTPELLSPPGLQKLIQYDEENNTEYIPTLRTYLDSNCSPTETIQKMYLARSTFLRRLEKIKKILKMDLEHADVRLYLSIILRLI